MLEASISSERLFSAVWPNETGASQAKWAEDSFQETGQLESVLENWESLAS